MQNLKNTRKKYIEMEKSVIEISCCKIKLEKDLVFASDFKFIAFCWTMETDFFCVGELWMFDFMLNWCFQGMDLWFCGFFLDSGSKVSIFHCFKKFQADKFTLNWFIFKKFSCVKI